MVPSGPPTPMGGGQPVPSSLLRSNSGVLGGQGGPLPSQPAFASLVSPRTQFGNNMNMSMLGNPPNMSSLLNNQSFANGVPSSVISGQRGGMDMGGAESDPLSNVGFSAPSSFVTSSMAAASGSSGQVQGQQFANPSSNQLLAEQQHSQQMEPQNLRHGQQSIQQQQFPTMRGGGLAGVGPVKLEPVKLEPGQATDDQHGQLQQSQQQLLRNLAPVKLEPQQLQAMRSMAQVKMEPQHSDQSLLLQQQQQQQQQRQQQQQQFLQMSGQSPQAQMNLYHQQQRLMQLQQQQQLMKSMPHQRPQLPQQFQPQNMPLRTTMKSMYEPGMGAQRLTQYMYRQQHRPEDNNIEFWRKFVAEYFAPNAKKRWCVSMYANGRQTGVFPQDVWHCEICNRKPGRGFEATAEVLPRLFKIKYESGTLEELLYVDMPRESPNSSGQIVLEYAKAIQESVFEHLRVVRDGQLRIVFSLDLKICSWEFCARHHEELIPRRLLIPQVTQLGTAAQKYQQATQNANSDSSVSDLQNNCNMFVASARQLVKALEVPLVNDLGYTKRYVRCLQISEVVNSMKDLIDYSRETGTGPIESLAEFPRRTSSSSALPGHSQPSEQLRQEPQPQQQPTVVQNTNGDQSSGQGAPMQVNPSNGLTSVHNSFNAVSATASTSTIAGLIHQNSINSRQQNTANNPNSPYGGNSVQMPSPSSSSTMPPSQQHNLPSFQSPTSSTNNNNNPSQSSQNGLTSVNHLSAANSPVIQQPAPNSSEMEANESQSSVQKILHELMMSNQIPSTAGVVGPGSYGNNTKTANGIAHANNSLVGNGPLNSNNNPGIGSPAFGAMVGVSTANGIRAAMSNSHNNNNANAVMNGRVGMMGRDQSMGHQQQDLGNSLLSGLGAANGFNNFQFDWNG